MDMSFPIIPFSFARREVSGPSFIGREQELRILCSNALNGRPTFIVGLPRMGKSSLVRQCFLEQQKEWREVHGMFPLYVLVGACRNPVSFWKSVATKIRIFLAGNRLPADLLEPFQGNFTEDDMYQALLVSFNRIDSELGLKPILILDDFDYIRDISVETGFFDRLREMSSFGSIVICSRRTPEFIEKSLFGKSYCTNNADQLFLGPFKEEEVDAYWERFGHFFSSFSKEQFSSYRGLVREYAGNHPMVMSLINNTLFKFSDRPYEIWDPEFPAQQREEAERTMRRVVREEFDWQMHYVEEQGLKDAAVQLVVGSSRVIPDQLRDLLLDYQFLGTVTSSEKQKMFGYNLGPTTRDGKRRYVCFSALTSHLMKDQYDPDIQEYDLLKTTELHLRDVVEEFLKEICKYEDPFERVTIRINPDEPLEERERWEAVLYGKIRCFRTNRNARNDFLNDLDEMGYIRDSRERNDCDPAFDRSKINKMTSTTLGQLWHVFLKWQWTDYFSEILDPLRNYPGDGSLWYENVFKTIQEWRNAANHYHDDELSPQFIQRAKSLAKEIDKNITLWLGTREKS